MALGLGETLASGNVRGTPWRFDVSKETKKVTVKTFSSFGEMYVADESASYSSGALKMKRVFCDDSNHWLTTDEARRNKVIGERLGSIGMFLETSLGNNKNIPQDVEGCILSDGTINIVQARPQP